MSVVNDALVATEDSAPIAFQLGNSRSGAIGAKLSGKVLNSLLQQRQVQTWSMAVARGGKLK
jgi:hypothetical protein